MSRELTPEQQAAAEADHLAVVFMARMDLDSGIVAVHTGLGTITHGGVDYLGVGNVGTIDEIEEGSEARVYGCRFQLSGLPPENIAIALAEPIQGRIAKLWVAQLDTRHHTLIGDPILLGRYRLDTMPITLGDKSVIQVTAENALSRWGTPIVARYNHEDQISRYPDDKGVEFVAQMVEKEIRWGVK